MESWTFLAVLVVVVTVSHEIGFTSAADGPALAKFKKSLSAEEQALLKRHASKGHYIESMLGRSKGVDKRDQIVPAPNKRSEISETECCSCNPGSEGCYHPDDKKRSRIIRCCIPGSSPQKRDEDEVDAQEALAESSPADQELLKKHMSKIDNLVNAANQEAGQETKTKRRVNGSGVDITKRFVEDVELAKKYGVKLEDLLGAIRRRAATVEKQKQGKH